MEISDVGLILQIIGFMFAFATFRAIFVALGELILMAIIVISTVRKLTKNNLEGKSFREVYEIGKKKALDVGQYYDEHILPEKLKKGEKGWPILTNALRFVGWFLVTIGLILQFSFFNQ